MLGAPGYTIPRHKTHSTALGDEVTVAYSWHPWAGQLVRIHQLTERRSDTWARCSPVDVDVARPRWIPTWMLDASACCSMRRVSEPVVALSALMALRSLLSEAMRTAAAPPEAAVASPPAHSGGRHAPSPSPGQGLGASGRFLLGATARNSSSTAVEQPTEEYPAHRDGADNALVGHARGGRGTTARGRRR
jgi:hypothetical protein